MYLGSPLVCSRHMHQWAECQQRDLQSREGCSMKVTYLTWIEGDFSSIKRILHTYRSYTIYCTNLQLPKEHKLGCVKGPEYVKNIFPQKTRENWDKQLIVNKIDRILSQTLSLCCLFKKPKPRLEQGQTNIETKLVQILPEYLVHIFYWLRKILLRYMVWLYSKHGKQKQCELVP